MDDIVRAANVPLQLGLRSSNLLLLFPDTPLNVFLSLQPYRLNLCLKSAAEILLSDPAIGKSPTQIEVLRIVASGFPSHFGLLFKMSRKSKIRILESLAEK